jgi:hypothetical protein
LQKTHVQKFFHARKQVVSQNFGKNFGKNSQNVTNVTLLKSHFGKIRHRRETASFRQVV